MSTTIATLSRAYATACANRTIYTHPHTRRLIIAGPVFDREFIAQSLVHHALQEHFPLSSPLLHSSHIESITAKALEQPLCSITGMGIQIDTSALVQFLSHELPCSF